MLKSVSLTATRCRVKVDQRVIAWALENGVLDVQGHSDTDVEMDESFQIVLESEYEEAIRKASSQRAPM